MTDVRALPGVVVPHALPQVRVYHPACTPNWPPLVFFLDHIFAGPKQVLGADFNFPASMSRLHAHIELDDDGTYTAVAFKGQQYDVRVIPESVTMYPHDWTQCVVTWEHGGMMIRPKEGT